MMSLLYVNNEFSALKRIYVSEVTIHRLLLGRT